ncbi:MAG: hypothetical protein N2513_01450 [Deltaproteobacteria bacterium]|nr:hypothetical protein [Deltaproteobacteria bacterium]
MLIRSLLIIFLFLPLSSYAIWPFFYEFGEEKRLLGPFISLTDKEEKEELIVRPLFLIYENENGGVVRFPYPLARFGPKKSYFVPFYMSQEQKERKNYSFFLFFYGKENNETYGGLFPIYGHLKNRFGNEDIRFFLWPLYSSTEVEKRKKENFFWPIFSIYSGEEKGFKVFPFYGRREIEGRKKTEFFFWPFIYREIKGLDTEDPYSSFYFVPFYLTGKKESGSLESLCVMFPLYCRFKNPYRTKVSYFWPFITVSEGKEKGVSIFPLFKNMVSAEYKTEGFLWPFLYTKKESIDEEEKEIDIQFLLLNRYERKKEALFVNLWPFFGYEKKEGSSKLAVPFVFPFKFEGFQKIINPLFSIVEYKKQGDWEGLNILYGLYTQERKKNTWKRRLAFLLEVKKEENETAIKFFCGLLGFQKSKVTLFFVPFSRDQKDTQNVP